MPVSGSLAGSRSDSTTRRTPRASTLGTTSLSRVRLLSNAYDSGPAPRSQWTDGNSVPTAPTRATLGVQVGISRLDLSASHVLTDCEDKTSTCCPGVDLSCSAGRECCGRVCCREGQVCGRDEECVLAASTAESTSATRTRVTSTRTTGTRTTGTRTTGTSTTNTRTTGTTTRSTATTPNATQTSEGGARKKEEEEGPKKGFSLSDKIALGCGIGIGLPTLLVAIWSVCGCAS